MLDIVYNMLALVVQRDVLNYKSSMCCCQFHTLCRYSGADLGFLEGGFQ